MRSARHGARAERGAASRIRDPRTTSLELTELRRLGGKDASANAADLKREPAGVDETPAGQRDPRARRSMMQDDSRHHSPQAYVYVGGHAFTLDELWSGVDRLERRGVSLAAIGRALDEDWETSVIALARLGRRRP
jgi:hypothetical protein